MARTESVHGMGSFCGGALGVSCCPELVKLNGVDEQFMSVVGSALDQDGAQVVVVKLTPRDDLSREKRNLRIKNSKYNKRRRISGNQDKEVFK